MLQLQATNRSCPSMYFKICLLQNKVQVKLQESWNGEDIMKVICANICVPLDALKLVHRGRFVNSDSIKDFIRPKAVFQAIGTSQFRDVSF